MRKKSETLMNQIIEFIDKEYEKNGRVPSFSEIATKTGVTKGCISKYITEMTERGLVKQSSGSRGIITKSMEKGFVQTLKIPVVGTIACGLPILAEENIESYLTIPKDFLGSGDHFILKAQGNSMINAGISENDYVIIRQQNDAEQGQIVVALVDNEATLKRYYKDNVKQKIRLHPENDEMEDIFFDNIVIQGIAVKVIKDL